MVRGEKEEPGGEKKVIKIFDLAFMLSEETLCAIKDLKVFKKRSRR